MHHTAAARAGTRALEAQPHSHVILNKVTTALLRSPLHFLVSGNLLLITFTGRKSGKQFTTPVTYTQKGDVVRVFSNQRWWRNLVGGAAVTVRLRGSDIAGHAEVVQDGQVVLDEIADYLASNGVKRAFMINLPLDAARTPSADEIAQAARGHIVVRIALQPQAPHADVARKH